MTQQMPNDEVDTALILENELKRRVREVARTVVRDEVRAQMEALFIEKKAEMLMEICIAVGKTMQVIENEGRKPLWEAKPEDFGLTHEELNRSSMRNLEEEPDYAIR
jgi:hypothetical protein